MTKILKTRKFRLLLACISLLLLIDMIQESYAKYVSSAEADSDLTIASWAFIVNNQDVISNNDFSNSIVPVIDANTNIKTGYIAPTSTGYFDITIDSSDVEVAFDEEITFSPGQTNTVSDIVFTGYSLNNGTVTQFSDPTSPMITSSHNLNEQVTTNTYRIYIEWIDGTGEDMDNAADTQAAVNGIATITTNINFIQRASQNNSTPTPTPNPEPDPEP